MLAWRSMDLQKKITSLEKTVARLREQLVTDELTQILNRRGLDQFIEPVTKEVQFQIDNPERRRNVIIRHFSLIFVDIDHFKKINDTYGHQVGDEALKAVAKILRTGVRGIDIVGRWGGEELLMGLIGADAKDAQTVAEHLRQKIAETKFVFGDTSLSLTASFGVAELKRGMSLAELTRLADEALIRAKESGRNKVVTA